MNTQEIREKIISRFMAENGKKGGLNRSKKLSSKRLSEIGKMGADGREKKRRDRIKRERLKKQKKGAKEIKSTKHAI